jgi:hypothetical protein
MCYRLIRLQTLLLIITVSLPAMVGAQAQFTIAASPGHSNDGRVVVSWETPPGRRVHIQQDQTGAFEMPSTLYHGSDNASVVTGLVDGHYHFRGRLETADGTASQWSPSVKVTVEHHSLSRALFFFMVGLVVFLATLLLIVLGARRHDGTGS